ncbi:MAG: dihydroorotate dehydrogenase electron transfer subunit [Oscillospiraceae bacterium]|nr:dihydroorotate dehydrogenase electron transfer subunit [Oscillospiraceae bacterium]
MKYTQGRYVIVDKKAIAKGVFDFTISCKEVADVAQCGQFVHIAADGFSLRRPISICDIDKEKGTLRIVFEVRGKGTEKISELNKGDLIDMIAPLGKGFKVLEKGKKAICIGGGIGTPPMLAIAKEYGENATVISGFRNAAIALLQDDFKAQGNNTILCTDDGSAGRKGFVTEALKECLINEKPDIIYACGPNVMLKAVAEIARDNGIYCQVSLEERMGCGVGACLVCACKTVKDGEEYFAHVCKDGPVFSAEEVIF